MITQAETEAKPLAFNLHLFKTVLSLFAMLLLGACSNNKRTVDTDIDPIITEDNRLQVTLRDGSTVDLRIRRTLVVGSPGPRSKFSTAVTRTQPPVPRSSAVRNE